MSLFCQSLSYTCSIEQRQLLENIDLSLNQGDHVFIHSHDMPPLSALAVILSGLGKQHLNGEISGSIHWDNEQNPKAGNIVLLQGGPAEQLSGCCFSVRDELIFGAENIGLPAPNICRSMEKLVKVFELEHVLEQDPFSLSGGEQQRLLLAAILIMKPKMLILQEPFSQLSPSSVKKFASWLSRQKDTTIIYLSSNKELYNPWVKKRYDLDGSKLTEGEKLSEVCLSSESSLAQSSLQGSQNEVLLNVDNLSFQYPGQPGLLKNLSFSLKKGEVVALRGENGSGKSTLLNLLQGHLHPDNGDIKFRGKSICSLQPWERANDIGFVFQQPEEQIFSSTIKEELSYGPQNTNTNKTVIQSQVENVAAFLQLNKYLNMNPLDGHYQQRKTVNLGSIMTMNPRLFLLDEPSAGIGEQQRKLLVEYILKLQKAGSTFLIVSHDPVFIEACCQRSIHLSDKC